LRRLEIIFWKKKWFVSQAAFLNFCGLLNAIEILNNDVTVKIFFNCDQVLEFDHDETQD